MFEFDVIILCVDNLATRLYVNESVNHLYRKLKTLVDQDIDSSMKALLRKKLEMPLFCDLGSEEFLAHCKIMSNQYFLFRFFIDLTQM